MDASNQSMLALRIYERIKWYTAPQKGRLNAVCWTTSEDELLGTLDVPITEDDDEDGIPANVFVALVQQANQSLSRALQSNENIDGM